MKIELHKIKIEAVASGYVANSEDNSVVGYGGKLNIRPKYQREFVYKDKQRDAVINTIMQNFPLNVLYWCDNKDDTFEVLDGQQRTISICEYISNNFSINNLYFNNLTKTEQQKILNYELMVYICDGNDKEKLDWFKIINIAGEKLSDQELRNAIYTGEWLADAKKYFSKNGCTAYKIAEKLLNGSAIRQDYLETAIKWLSGDKDRIEEYMSKNQHNSNSNELWLYFQNVINWVNVIFSKYRKEMKGIDWGFYYNKFKDKNFDAKKLEKQIEKLIKDDDITKKSGIYEYLIDGQEKHLSIRSFSDNMKREAYERQVGICAKCNKHFELNEMEADHITPWSKGGKTNVDNCQMLCEHCNRKKSNK